MKKPFLVSVATLAATFTLDANAALPETVSTNLPVPEAKTTQQDLEAQPLFVLVRPNKEGALIAYHSSHASHVSHASHASHASSRY